MSEPTVAELRAQVADVNRNLEEHLHTIRQALVAARKLQGQLEYYQEQDRKVRARTVSPERCRHPDQCANMGRCCANWECK